MNENQLTGVFEFLFRRYIRNQIAAKRQNVFDSIFVETAGDFSDLFPGGIDTGQMCAADSRPYLCLMAEAISQVELSARLPLAP